VVIWCKCEQRTPIPGRSLCHSCISEEKSKGSPGNVSKGDVEDDSVAFAFKCLGITFALGSVIGTIFGWILRGLWS
jgi:hypothetical protein